MTDDALREELQETRVAWQGRLLTVHVDTVRLPDGHVSTREVIAHPGAVAMVPIDADGCVLLVRQWRHAAGQALLEIPAGTLEAGEEPAACAARMKEGSSQKDRASGTTKLSMICAGVRVVASL